MVLFSFSDHTQGTEGQAISYFSAALALLAAHVHTSLLPPSVSVKAN